MAYKKKFKRGNYSKKKRGRKKYSLKERIAFWDKVADDEYKKFGGDYKKRTGRYEYAMGFLQGAERGRSLNFDELSKSTQSGELAGERARQKSHNVKF